MLPQHFPVRILCTCFMPGCDLRYVRYRVKVAWCLFPVAVDAGCINDRISRSMPGYSSVNACCPCEQGKWQVRTHNADRDASLGAALYRGVARVQAATP
jgi:hypothetical protein